MPRYVTRRHLHPTLGASYQIVDTLVKTITGSEVVGMVGGDDGEERAQRYADAMNRGNADAEEATKAEGPRHRDCGHSPCGQNYIDTGDRRCLQGRQD